MITVNTMSRMTLAADTAQDLMTRSPVSVSADASLHEAIVLLTDRGYSAAPVIDDAGRPVGVLSVTDIVVHDREHVEYLERYPEYYHQAELKTKAGESLKGFNVERVDQTRVKDLMTPAVFSVAPDTLAAKVVSEMLALRVHRLFVVDGDGVLVGVISALDVMKRLRME
jgi:CBS domain-containing protein